MITSLRIRPTFIALAIALFISQLLFAQDEKVIFDLDKGEFNIKKIPYVHAITVSGEAEKKGEQVDALLLTVTKVTDKEKKELDALLYQSGELKAKMEKEKSDTEFLNSLISGSIGDYAVLEKSLNEKDFIELQASVHSISASDPAREVNTKTIIQDKIDQLKKEYAENEKKKITQDKNILDLKEEVDGLPFFQGLWQRTGAEKEFSFSLGERLEMSEKYIFTFSIYQLNTTTFPIDQLLDPLVQDFDEALSKAGYYSIEEITKRVTEIEETIEKRIFPAIYKVDASGKAFSSPGLHLDATKLSLLADNLAEYYAFIKSAEANKVNVKIKEEEIIALITGKAGITLDQLKTLRRWVEDPRSYDVVTFTAALTAASFTLAERNAILNVNKYPAIKMLRDNLAGDEAGAAKALASVKKEFEFIKSLFIAKGNVSYTGQTGTSGATDVDGIRISTTYGIGLIPLEKKFEAIEWYQFIAANIRFDDFDNRLPGKEAYHSFWSRCAVLVGVATTSDMQYHGQKLENLRIGIKPVIGLSFEPLKHLNISSGIISFIPSPIGNSQADPKVRPYISLAFDFNLFNYLIQKD